MRAWLTGSDDEPIPIARKSIRDSDTETSNRVCAPRWSARVRTPHASVLCFFTLCKADTALLRGWDELGMKSGARRPAGRRSSSRLEAHSERGLLHDGRIVSCKQATCHSVVIFDQAKRLRCAAKLFRRDPKLVSLTGLGLCSNRANREHARLQVDRQQECG